MELPTTIEECLEALRNRPDYSDDSEEAVYYWTHQHSNAARVTTSRLNEIVDIVRTLPKEALCVPKSTGEEILAYIEFIDRQKQSEFPYSGKFRDAYLHAANDKNPEFLRLEYVNGEDDGYPEYGRIDVPTAWLVCPAEELRRLVLSQVHNDLRKYVDISKKRLDEVLNVLSAFEAKFGAETFAPEIEASKYTKEA